MHRSVNALSLVTDVGKAAVGGAGLTLAVLGGLNVVLAAFAALVAGAGHGVLDDVGVAMPYLVAVGAMANAAWTYRHARNS